MSDRYFYHSFPRRPGIDRAARGLSILKSILDRGLLLTPEIIAFREQLRGGGQAPEWRIAQKRICFTELSPRELPPHAETFGPFALEFEIEALRKMGAIPTLYVPLRANPDALDGLGAAALARLGEAQQVLARLTQLNHLVRDRPPGETLNITRNATPIAATHLVHDLVEDVISHGARIVGGALGSIGYSGPALRH